MATTAAGAGEVGQVALALVPQGHIQWTWSRPLACGNTQESQGPHWWDSRWGYEQSRWKGVVSTRRPEVGLAFRKQAEVQI